MNCSFELETGETWFGVRQQNVVEHVDMVMPESVTTPWQSWGIERATRILVAYSSNSVEDPIDIQVSVSGSIAVPTETVSEPESIRMFECGTVVVGQLRLT